MNLSIENQEKVNHDWARKQKQILDSFIENINCISDEKYQEKYGYELKVQSDDIDDTVSDFSMKITFRKLQEFGITESQQKAWCNYTKATNIHRQFWSLLARKTTEKLIKLPEWQKLELWQ
jgi:hypothetical protein